MYTMPPTYALIFLVGVIGNGSLLYMFGSNKMMRTVPNLLIFNLAIGDILALIFTVPFTLTIYTHDSWPFGAFMCPVSEFAKVICNNSPPFWFVPNHFTVCAGQDTSVAVSIYTLTALSLDRYNVVVRPVQSFVGGSKSRRIVLLVLIWVLSIGMALPAALFTRVIEFRSKETVTGGNGTLITPVIRFQVCYPFPTKFGPRYPQVIVLTRFVVQYVLPLVVIGTLYTIMGLHLFRRFSSF